MTRETSSRTLIRNTWKQSQLADLADTPLNFDLIGRSCLDDKKRDGYYGLLLSELIASFGGERAFVFAVEPTQNGPPELAGCVASRDLDGDPVSSPDRKVPRELLQQIASRKEPYYRPWQDRSEDGTRESGLFLIPVVSRGHCLVVIAVENRFQGLSLSEPSLRSALLYCRLLSWQLDLEQLCRENESLWTDLSRLRDSVDPDVKIPARPATPKASRPENRKGLKGDYSMIVGSSPKILEILQVIDRISGSNAPVLIDGESGTGKELCALAVHANNPRQGKPFVSENCAAITETLLESELFGYVRGAFTGANKDHKGLFELADGGTLFLDEVGDMSPSMQKKLLRVLQEGVIRRVGAKEYTTVDVRIISATNKELLEQCRRGHFREDLYYRLNVINLRLPPLRERREDIAELVQVFLDELAQETGTSKVIDSQAMQALVQYSWPGNVRELQNEVKKLFALSDGETIGFSDLGDSIISDDDGGGPFRSWPFDLSHLTLKDATEQLEKEMIRGALTETGGNKSLVAKTLQIPKTSLYNKINKYQL